MECRRSRFLSSRGTVGISVDVTAMDELPVSVCAGICGSVEVASLWSETSLALRGDSPSGSTGSVARGVESDTFLESLCSVCDVCGCISGASLGGSSLGGVGAFLIF